MCCLGTWKFNLLIYLQDQIALQGNGLNIYSTSHVGECLFAGIFIQYWLPLFISFLFSIRSFGMMKMFYIYEMFYIYI